MFSMILEEKVREKKNKQAPVPTMKVMKTSRLSPWLALLSKARVHVKPWKIARPIKNAKMEAFIMVNGAERMKIAAKEALVALVSLCFSGGRLSQDLINCGL